MGDDYEWWSDEAIVAELVLKGIDEEIGVESDTHYLDYEQCYALFDYLGYPWILDTHFNALFRIDTDGAGHNAITGFMRDWMFSSDSWSLTPPEGWLYMEDRMVPYHPYEPSEDLLKLYLRDEIQDAIDRLEELDDQVSTEPLSEMDWDSEDDEQLDDLSDLLFEVQEYAEDTYVLM